MTQINLSIAGGDGGGYDFTGAGPDERFKLIGLGKTGCSAISVLNAEGDLDICAIKIARGIHTDPLTKNRKVLSYDAQDDRLSSYLDNALTASWVTIVLIDLNDELFPETLDAVVRSSRQQSELSMAIVIEKFNKDSSSDRHLEIIQKLDTCIYLSRECLWDIGKKTQRLRLCGAKEYSFSHLSLCFKDILLGNGLYGIDHIDIKNLFLGKFVTVALGAERSEGRITKAFQQAISSPGCHICQTASILACVAFPSNLVMEEFLEIDLALEAHGICSYIVDMHPRDELNEDLLLTLFIANDQPGQVKE